MRQGNGDWWKARENVIGGKRRQAQENIESVPNHEICLQAVANKEENKRETRSRHQWRRNNGQAGENEANIERRKTSK